MCQTKRHTKTKDAQKPKTHKNQRYTKTKDAPPWWEKRVFGYFEGEKIESILDSFNTGVEPLVNTLMLERIKVLGNPTEIFDFVFGSGSYFEGEKIESILDCSIYGAIYLILICL